MRAIVLSGGGAKGAYEVGVWKALRKLHIKYDIVTGTSIGALNGMLMVQHEYYKCLRFWKNLSYEKIYDNFIPSKKAKQMYLNYLNKIIGGGIGMEKMEDMLEEYYKPHKLYSSKISFGVVAYNLSTMEVVNATKKNTRPDKLKKYILASATCFPVFKPYKIGTDTYIDGGYYDNLPINLAIDLGADEIIAVDLGSLGLRKKIKDKKIKITYIAPNNKLDSFLLFDSKAAKRMINLGYNDAMKTFGKLEGNLYTFKKGTISSNHFRYKVKLRNLIESKKEFQIGNLKRFLESRNSKNIMGIIVEDAMEIFKLKVDFIYNSIDLNWLLLDKLDDSEDMKLDAFDIDEIKKILNRDIVVKYIYKSIKKGEKINYKIFSFFTKEFTTAIYLLAIRS